MSAITNALESGDLTTVRRLLPTTRIWTAGYNLPGCLPDNEPCFFIEWKAAQTHLQGELEWALEDYSEDPGFTDPGYQSALNALKVAEPDNWSFTIGSYNWFITEV